MSQPTAPIRIGFISKFPIEAYLRQTPGSTGRFGRIQLCIGETRNVDYVAVHHQMVDAIDVAVPRERCILLASEPPDLRPYRRGYTNQFGILISPYAIPGYEGEWIQSQAGLAWFFGAARPDGPLYGLDQLLALAPPSDRAARLSIICSTKRKRKRHRQRLALIERIKERFPGRIELYGRGVREVEDKADAILPNRYHLVIENNLAPHLWTEKIADAYLGLALPLFSGCPNITDYFPARSLVMLPPLEEPDAVLNMIGDVLDRDPFESHLPAIVEARRRLVEEHNLAPLLERVLRPTPLVWDETRKPTRLLPIRYFRGWTGLAHALRLPV